MERVWRAFFHSLDGLKSAWRDEAAFREEVILSIILIPSAIYLAPNDISLILMIGSVLLVLIVELVNTAVEAAIDRIGLEIHPLSKKALHFLRLLFF